MRVSIAVIIALFACMAEAQLIVAKPDKWGQPLATWTDPPAKQWDGNAQLPEGEYTLSGLKTDKTLLLPIKGKIVIKDSQLKRIESFVADGVQSDMEVVVSGCTFTDQFAIHRQTSCDGVALVNCAFKFAAGPRNSYVYISTRGPNYIDGLTCEGGYSKDNGQHSIDLGTTGNKLISVRGVSTAGGSTSSLNIHVKAGGLETLWVSDSVLRDKTGIDCADVNNSKTIRTKAIKCRNVEFALQQHPTMPTSMYVLFPAHAVDEFHGLGGVKWTSGGSRAWPTDAEYGSIRPKIVGTLPWDDSGARVTTTTPIPPVTPPATQPTQPPATQPATPAKPRRIIMDLDADGKPVKVTVE